MQNPHFGLQIKIPKKHAKFHSANHLQLFGAKNRSKRQKLFAKLDHFQNWPSAKAIAMQNPHFGSKIKTPKNISKSVLQIIYSCLVQKTAQTNTKYSRNGTILKIDHHAKAIAHAKSSLWVKK